MEGADGGSGSSVQKEQEGAINMPGVLKRPYGLLQEDGTVGASSDAESPRKRQSTEMNNGNTGSHQALSNGTSTTENQIYADGSVAAPAVNGDNLTATVAALSANVPPEIEHITHGYVPLSRLITRLCEETWAELLKLINQLADDDLGLSDLGKKQLLWDFAQDRRTKLVKVLVLSQWSRHAEEVSKLVDINAWIMSQKELYKSAANWMGELKRIMEPLPLPSPDIKTSLEILSTGKAAWISDVKFTVLSRNKMLTFFSLGLSLPKP